MNVCLHYSTSLYNDPELGNPPRVDLAQTNQGTSGRFFHAQVIEVNPEQHLRCGCRIQNLACLIQVH